MNALWDIDDEKFYRFVLPVVYIKGILILRVYMRENERNSLLQKTSLIKILLFCLLLKNILLFCEKGFLVARARQLFYRAFIFAF